MAKKATVMYQVTRNDGSWFHLINESTAQSYADSGYTVHRLIKARDAISASNRQHNAQGLRIVSSVVHEKVLPEPTLELGFGGRSALWRRIRGWFGTRS